MTKKPRLEVVDESDTGLNRKFRDTKTNKTLNRGDVVKNIDQYDDYHVMKINNKNVVRSNPDRRKNNNLD